MAKLKKVPLQLIKRKDEGGGDNPRRAYLLALDELSGALS